MEMKHQDTALERRIDHHKKITNISPYSSFYKTFRGNFRLLKKTYKLTMRNIFAKSIYSFQQNSKTYKVPTTRLVLPSDLSKPTILAKPKLGCSKDGKALDLVDPALGDSCNKNK
ncbi:hypothetical protein Leryth_023437, partial [Lithospermum erythrorhizon]